MPEAAPVEYLEVSGLNAWYGESHVLHGADFSVRRGEVVTLLGRNGAGKTTTLKSIMGIVTRRTGTAQFEGRELLGLPSDQVARLGIAFCPEERGIFASLDVEENLLYPGENSDLKPTKQQCRPFFLEHPCAHGQRKGKGWIDDVR